MQKTSINFHIPLTCVPVYALRQIRGIRKAIFHGRVCWSIVRKHDEQGEEPNDEQGY